MSQPVIGEIRIFREGAIPADWLECNGQVVSTAKYKVLHTVIGDAYPGGDGVRTFAVPDLRSRAITNAATEENFGKTAAPAAISDGIEIIYATVIFAIAAQGDFPMS